MHGTMHGTYAVRHIRQQLRDDMSERPRVWVLMVESGQAPGSQQLRATLDIITLRDSVGHLKHNQYRERIQRGYTGTYTAASIYNLVYTLPPTLQPNTGSRPYHDCLKPAGTCAGTCGPTGQ